MPASLFFWIWIGTFKILICTNILYTKIISFGSGLIVVCVWHNKTHSPIPTNEKILFFLFHKYIKEPVKLYLILRLTGYYIQGLCHHQKMALWLSHIIYVLYYLIHLWNVKNNIVSFEGMGECVLLCQTQTTLKPDPNDIIFV